MQFTFANRENGINKRTWRQLSKLGWLAILAFVVGLSTAASAQTPKLMVRGKLQYVHGINLAWMFGRYSTDLGLNPLHPEWGCGYNATTANNWLNDIDQMKVNVVRLWLFEGMEGLTFDQSGYVSGIQDSFLLNLDDMIAKANAKGLAYELVLLVHTADLELGKPLPNGVIIKNFLTDTTARQKFLTNAVRQLAVRYQGNQAVFSYDIMNEADLGVMRGVCNRTQLRAFVTACATEIHGADATAQVTCSCAFYKFNSIEEHNTWFGGLGLDYYENHNYATVPDLKVVPAWLDKPLLSSSGLHWATMDRRRTEQFRYRSPHPSREPWLGRNDGLDVLAQHWLWRKHYQDSGRCEQLGDHGNHDQDLWFSILRSSSGAEDLR
jgi:hypothetical protein